MRTARRLALTIVLFVGLRGAARAVAIGEYVLPSANGGPTGIVAGADGAVWFTEEGANQIGRITIGGTITEFPVPTPHSAPVGIAAGPDGALWFTELTTSQIGRITTAGALSEYSIPTPSARPQGIAAGPDGALWFTEFATSKIGRISTGGVFTEYALPAGTEPAFIAAGPDGALWFTESAAAANQIGRITTKGVITEYPVPTASSQPFAITVGPDGALWFTERLAKRIGRISTSGTVTELPSIGPGYGIAAGPDGKLWFTEPEADKISSISTAGVVAEVAVPTANAGPQGIAAGPDGNLWFAETAVARIGRVTFQCTPAGPTLCLDDQPGDRRWQITAAFATAQGGGKSGNGQAIPLASLGVARGGLFWFFTADNPELLVKVLDGCALNQEFWVFASAATNVGFTVTVLDTRTGRAKAYTNRDGVAAPPVEDTSAFACIDGDASPRSEPPSPVEPAPGGGPALTAPEPTWTASWPADPPPTPDSAVGATGAGSAGEPFWTASWPAEPSPMLAAGAPGTAEVAAGAAPESTCASTGTAVCIDGRFQVAVRFHLGGGDSGDAQAISLQSLGVAQGGLFWFFAADNPEMLIKVLDGCGVNHNFWIFYAAATNVGFTVTVTDTQTSRQRTYTNPIGTAAPPLQDTSALPCG